MTNPRKASKALQKVVDEMENRYELFAKVGVRNIAGFNARQKSSMPSLSTGSTTVHCRDCG